MKINLKTMLKHAQIKKYAIPSFNFDNLEILIATGVLVVVAAATTAIVVVATKSTNMFNDNT